MRMSGERKEGRKEKRMALKETYGKCKMLLKVRQIENGKRKSFNIENVTVAFLVDYHRNLQAKKN